MARWHFQSVRFGLNFGRFVSVGAQRRDHAVHLVPLLGRGLEELHSHPEFRMRDEYDASRVDFEFGGLDRKNDTCSPREGRVCREIAAAEAQVAETATHRRGTRVGFRKMAAPPPTKGQGRPVGYDL